MSDPDAVVIGAGPNGLVAANYLADEGWDVLVLEAQSTPGGAVKSGPLTGDPAFVRIVHKGHLRRPMRDLRLLDYERHTLEYALR